MLSREKAFAALEAKRSQFQIFQDRQRQQFAQADERLANFMALSSEAILSLIDAQGIEWPGALPTTELDVAERLRIPFGQSWRTHQDARAWALEVLRDRTVAAVDGSQIMPDRDLSLPVGAVQVGWFINYHRAGGAYEKDVAFEVLAPAELADDGEEGEFPDWRVNQRRFVAECDQLIELMERFAPEPPQSRPVCFFDGSLVVSFASQLRPERAQGYLVAIRKLLDASREWHVPLVGFVDSSASRDVLTLVNSVIGTPHLTLADGLLLNKWVPDWGDRSPLFICARKDMLSTSGRADFYREIAFCYVRLAAGRPPARVEMPRWMVDEGWADQVLDIVRAECVAGTGYPYAIETADAVAVLQQADRVQFLELLQQFAERNGMTLSRSQKSRSKRTRR